MKDNVVRLKKAVTEYKSIIYNADSSKLSCDNIDWNEVEKELIINSEWTKEGAQSILALARNYGSFVLLNALALAIAANVEDGKLNL